MSRKSFVVLKEVLSTAEVMRTAGVGRNTLRLYEGLGLISKPRRTASNYRVFARDVLADLQFITQAKDAGLTLAEIKELLQLTRADQATCGRVSAQVEGKLAEIDVTMAALAQKKAFLANFLDTCRATQAASRCDVRQKGFTSSACCG